MTDANDIQIFLPKYLSEEKQKDLFDKLKSYPRFTKESVYTDKLKHSEILYQGDGVEDLTIPNEQRTKFINVKSIILSNTCDNSSENKRKFFSNIVYAPIFSLSKYVALLKQNSSKAEIDNHILALKDQQITQIFFLPKRIFPTGQGPREDCFARLDQANSCHPKFWGKRKKKKIFSLSNYGFYFFLIKLSIHFSRLKENVERT